MEEGIQTHLFLPQRSVGLDGPIAHSLFISPHAVAARASDLPIRLFKCVHY